MIIVRKEKSEDVGRVYEINLKAFGQSSEAKIVDKLRQSCKEALFLVAEENGRLVGQITFSPVSIESNESGAAGFGLGPMAVIPNRQRAGIGSKLVYSGLDILRAQGCPFVVVLGHPEYYPRFDFVKASNYNVESQWNGVPDEAFMILVFDEKNLHDVRGIAVYRDEFNEAI